MAGALGIPPATVDGLTRKDEVLAAVIQEATKAPMDPDLYSPGTTVTNQALQVIIDGITINGVPGRSDPAPEVLEDEPDDFFGTFDLDLNSLSDLRDRRLVEVAQRQGQDRFRTALIAAYNGRCAVTGFNAAETLQAAHIFPYNGPASNRVTNGLLLRADIHTLFDRGALAIHETNHRILVSPHLDVTPYGVLGQDGRKLRLPKLRAHYPSVAALRSHRDWAGM